MIIKFYLLLLLYKTVFCEIEFDNHGYTLSPKSRSYLCKERINHDCGDIIWEPQSVEALKGFPETGPKDGKIASAGTRFYKLDEYGTDRWNFTEVVIEENTDSFIIPIHWFFTTIHRTSSFRIFFSHSGINEELPIIKSMFYLKKYCIDDFKNKFPEQNYEAICIVPKSFLKNHINKKMYLYMVWDIADTSNAFYQISDVIFKVGEIKKYDYKNMVFINDE